MNNDREQQRLQWDQLYQRVEKAVAGDRWLERYFGRLKDPAFDMFSCQWLELGSGLGADTRYLYERQIPVIATDWSHVALTRLQQELQGIRVMHLELENDLPFTDNAICGIVAGLSLHYFSQEVTRKIIDELLRVLVPGGVLLVRVNAWSEWVTRYSHFEHEEIEPHFFRVEGQNRRFFTPEELANYFSSFDEVSIEETSSGRYGGNKHCIELFARKPLEKSQGAG